jgi:ABC-2 type transport system ATP-binding protein
MNATIEIDGLRKRFGSTQALDGMTFTVQPGRVTGFVGPDGAGKSTTMRVVVGLDAPDAGTATIGGRPHRSPPNPLTHVGSLLDAGALQPGDRRHLRRGPDRRRVRQPRHRPHRRPRAGHDGASQRGG